MYSLLLLLLLFIGTSCPPYQYTPKTGGILCTTGGKPGIYYPEFVYLTRFRLQYKSLPRTTAVSLVIWREGNL